MSSILIICILFFSALISGIAVFFFKRDNPTVLKLVLAFSGAFLFAITALHLIPEVYHSGSTPAETIGLFIIGGFIFQLVLEHFSQGIEHGHIHHDSHAAFPLGILISLCLHAFLEGMPIASGHQTELVFGIAIHHIPASFALGSLMLDSRASKTKIFVFIFIFALMTPAGFLVSKGLSKGELGDISKHFDKIMAIVIGIFLHISTTILFESGNPDHHKFNSKKFLAILLGIGIAIVSLYAIPHDHSHHDHDHGHVHEHHEHEHHEHDHHHSH